MAAGEHRSGGWGNLRRVRGALFPRQAHAHPLEAVVAPRSPRRRDCAGSRHRWRCAGCEARRQGVLGAMRHRRTKGYERPRKAGGRRCGHDVLCLLGLFLIASLADRRILLCASACGRRSRGAVAVVGSSVYQNGPWNGLQFSGKPEMEPNNSNFQFEFVAVANAVPVRVRVRRQQQRTGCSSSAMAAASCRGSC
ncbi:unnamed protein product [Miscanthus lutarioriparius]|uniref:Uncharacterized protein n=1 Tax=Miscanthus lutarioriparius TaxID=422564 RepID=A0A811Q3L6_9POAL|nr:unnamed protein product [Miscanthus lutarioriparius]